MSTPRLRVRKPVSVRGLLVVAVLVGMLLGGIAEASWFVVWPVTYRLASWLVLSDPMAGFMMLASAFVIAMLLLALLFMIVIAASCQRLLVNAAASAAMVATFVVTTTLLDFLTPPFQSIVAGANEDLYFDLIGFAVGVTVAPAIAAGVAVIVALLVRTFVWRTIDQDGTLCFRCGYSLAQSSATMCPECGAPADGGGRVRHRAHRLTHWLGHRWRWLSIALIALVIGAIGWIILLEIPFIRFERSFATWTTGEPVVRLDFARPDYVLAANRERRVREGDDNVTVCVSLIRPSSVTRAILRVTVVFEDPATVDQHALRSFDSHALDSFSLRASRVQEGFQVVTTPPRDVAAHILHDGLDEALIARLVESARDRKVSVEPESDEDLWSRASMAWPDTGDDH